MFQKLMSRVLSAPDSPTADLYFRNACADYLDGTVEQIAPTVFASERACLVMRHDMRAGRLPDRRRLIYMLDDDVDAGSDDASLPFLYRQKLRLVERRAGRRIQRYAGVAVVASPRLARIFKPLMETHVLRPYWSERFAALDHFDRSTGSEDWVEMGYLGSTVHRSDLGFLLPVVSRLLSVHPWLRFHLPVRHRLPPALDGRPRVIRIPGAGWSAYRRELAARRFHIALYPLLDTPFNRARSPNKLIEHAVVGAAPVYSSSWRESRRVAAHGAGLCLENDPESWFEAVSALIYNARSMRRLAAGAQLLARELNDAAPQRRLWRSLLELSEPALA